MRGRAGDGATRWALIGSQLFFRNMRAAQGKKTFF